MSYRFPTFVAIAYVAAFLATCAMLAPVVVPSLATTRAYGAARAVSMADATYPADFHARLRPGVSVDVRHQCGHEGFFTEYSAYRHDGSALGAQGSNVGPFPFDYWRGAHGRVTFDGVTFHNGTRATVIVAGWCS